MLQQQTKLKGEQTVPTGAETSSPSHGESARLRPLERFLPSVPVPPAPFQSCNGLFLGGKQTDRREAWRRQRRVWLGAALRALEHQASGQTCDLGAGPHAVHGRVHEERSLGKRGR